MTCYYYKVLFYDCKSIPVSGHLYSYFVIQSVRLLVGWESGWKIISYRVLYISVKNVRNPFSNSEEETFGRTHAHGHLRTYTLTCIRNPTYVFVSPFCRRSVYEINVGFFSRLWCCCPSDGKLFLLAWSSAGWASRGVLLENTHVL
jgi:hypothetical protein